MTGEGKGHRASAPKAKLELLKNLTTLHLHFHLPHDFANSWVCLKVKNRSTISFDIDYG